MSVTDPDFNPSDDPVIREIKLRGSALGSFIENAVPPGRRRSIALTQLEQALMWAVKAAAVGDGE